MTIASIKRHPVADRHRKSRRPFGRILRTAAAAGALVAGATIASALATSHTPPGTPWLPQQAASVVQAAAQLPTPARQAQHAQMTTTAATTALVSINWAERTCTAFTTWEQRRSPANLNALVADSLHLGRSYLRADVGQLNADASSPSPTAVKYAESDDPQYVYEDCNNGSGL